MMTNAREASEKPAFEYWDFPEDATALQPASVPISREHKSYFEDLLRAGIEAFATDGEPLFVNLGLDFGTSSTKMIVRLPYQAGEPTIAIPAPLPCRDGAHSYLWKTVLWLRDDGFFFPWHEPDAKILAPIKERLLQRSGEYEDCDDNAMMAVDRIHVATAYLAFVVRYAAGWLLRNRPELLKGRKLVWFVNVGMPAASHDDPKLAGPYRRIAVAALDLAKADSVISVEAVRVRLDDPDLAEVSEDAADKLGVAVIPEVAANMAGYARSIRGAPGLYLLIDVGAMTLDVCMFRLNLRGGEANLYSFMAADIRPLGVQSYNWFLLNGKTGTGFVDQCNRTLRTVIWNTKVARDPNASCWEKGNEVPVYLAGGGAAHGVHRKIVTSTGPWLKRHTDNDGIRLLELPVPSTIDLPEPLQNFVRMSVAWGLSHPHSNIGRIHSVSMIPDMPPTPVVDVSQRYVSASDV